MQYRKKKELTDEQYGFDISIIVTDSQLSSVVQNISSVSARPLDEKVSKPPLPPKSLSVKKVLSSEKPNEVISSQPTNDTEEVNESNSDSEPETISEILQESPLDNVLLQDALTNFLDTYLTDKPIYSGLISGASFSVDSANTIKALFDSQLQVDMFADIKSELIVYLRDRFNNSQINVIEEAAVGQIGGSDPSRPKLYTDEDKLKYLAQKNPLLLKFKQQFNLDFK